MIARTLLAGVTLATLLAGNILAPLQAQPGPTGAKTVAVVGGFLIDGFGGPPLHDSVVLIEADRITAVGEEGRLASLRARASWMRTATR